MKIMQSIKPTNEQQKAMDLFETRKSLKIAAFAGTGKTATLTLLAITSRRPGIYLSFNKALTTEAKSKFPDWVQCKTTHAIAYHATPTVFRRNSNKMCGTVNGNHVAKMFDFGNLDVSSTLTITPRLRGCLVLETVRKYQLSENRDIQRYHVPDWGILASLSHDEMQYVQKDIVRYGQALWQRMTDAGDMTTPLGHSGYVKKWALTDPQIPGNYILMDEAQDLNPVMLGVLANQSVPVVYVGDKHQQIYAWRGAQNALEKVQTDCEAALTQSFRFGQTIAEAANKVLSALGEQNAIVGNPGISSSLRCMKPDAILCRTNTSLIEHTIQALNHGIKVFTVGGHNEIYRLLKGIERLLKGLTSGIEELFGLESWMELLIYAESDEGVDLRTLVRLVERYGIKILLKTISHSQVSEDNAKLILSTVHKAKGRQWPRVQVHDDFNLMSRSAEGLTVFNEEELRLFYVGLTRAQFEVSIPAEQAKLLGIRT